MERALDPLTLLALLGAGAVAGLVGLGVAIVNNDAFKWRRTFESFILAFLGAFLAHGLVSVVLSAGDDSRGTRLLVGWAFFGIHGLVDTVLAPFGVQALTTTSVLLVSAAAVGGVTGGLNGMFRVYPWDGLGVPQFLADVTWGLTGSTTGGLVHLFNCIFGTRAPDERKGANRFTTGFHMPGKDTFAFTQGSVMSNLNEAPDQPLWRHERLHVFQNRVFGPFFTLTYLGWMAIMLVPAAIVGWAKPLTVNGTTLGAGYRIEAWCYYSNPWETWAYRLQRHVMAGANDIHSVAEVRAQLSNGLSWTDSVVALASVPFFVVASASLLGLAVVTL